MNIQATNNTTQEMMDSIMQMLAGSVGIGTLYNSQMMKSLDAIMAIQRRFNITAMPSYLILKLMLLTSLLIKDDGCKEFLKVLKIPDESDARKLIKIIVEKNNLGEGDIKLFYNEGERLFSDFIHLIGLFHSGMSTLSYPLRERVGVREMSRESCIDFDNRSMEELGDINCMITGLFKEKVSFQKPFRYVEDETREDVEIFWIGKKEEVVSYVLRDTYHWLELKTNCEYCNFVFIVDTNGVESPLTMTSIRKNCEEKMEGSEWCRFIIEAEKLSGWSKNYILYLSDMELEMDKFIEGKEVKPWRNSINYRVDIDFGEIMKGGEADVEANSTKTIDACGKNVRFILLDRVRKVPMLFGKFLV